MFLILLLSLLCVEIAQLNMHFLRKSSNDIRCPVFWLKQWECWSCSGMVARKRKRAIQKSLMTYIVWIWENLYYLKIRIVYPILYPVFYIWLTIWTERNHQHSWQLTALLTSETSAILYDRLKRNWYYNKNSFLRAVLCTREQCNEVEVCSLLVHWESTSSS